MLVVSVVRKCWRVVRKAIAAHNHYVRTDLCEIVMPASMLDPPGVTPGIAGRWVGPGHRMLSPPLTKPCYIIRHVVYPSVSPHSVPVHKPSFATAFATWFGRTPFRAHRAPLICRWSWLLAHLVCICALSPPPPRPPSPPRHHHHLCCTLLVKNVIVTQYTRVHNASATPFGRAPFRAYRAPLICQ